MTRKESPRRLRYQSQGNTFARIALTGAVALKYVEDERLETPAKGDMMLYLSCENNPSLEPWNFERTGRAGYLRADVHDGRTWRPLSLEEFFDDREYFFSKSERAIDTALLCRGALEGFAGRQLMRTYREHYVLEPEGQAEETEQGD